MRIAQFVCDYNVISGGDKDRMHKLRDHLVFDWIRDQNQKYATISQESFRAFLMENLSDYADTDLHSQLMNAYAKCMQSMIPCTGSKRNNSGFRRRRRKRDEKRDGRKSGLHPCSSRCDDNAHQNGREDEAAQFNLNDLD